MPSRAKWSMRQNDEILDRIKLFEINGLQKLFEACESYALVRVPMVVSVEYFSQDIKGGRP